MPFALNSIIVPEGSVWYSDGPFSSTPAISKATPYGLDMGFFLEEGSPSPKFRAKSETDWVRAFTATGSRYVNLWLRAYTLACSIRVLASVMTPLAATAMWLSTSKIFSMLLGTIRVEFRRRSTARTTPSWTFMPTADEPSYVFGDDVPLLLRSRIPLGRYVLLGKRC